MTRLTLGFGTGIAVLGPPELQRSSGVAVEPMTCPPDAFNTGEGLVRLEPGQSHTATWGITSG